MQRTDTRNGIKPASNGGMWSEAYPDYYKRMQALGHAVRMRVIHGDRALGWGKDLSLCPKG